MIEKEEDTYSGIRQAAGGGIYISYFHPGQPCRAYQAGAVHEYCRQAHRVRALWCGNVVMRECGNVKTKRRWCSGVKHLDERRADW